MPICYPSTSILLMVSLQISGVMVLLGSMTEGKKAKHTKDAFDLWEPCWSKQPAGVFEPTCQTDQLGWCHGGSVWGSPSWQSQVQVVFGKGT